MSKETAAHLRVVFVLIVGPMPGVCAPANPSDSAITELQEVVVTPTDAGGVEGTAEGGYRYRGADVGPLGDIPLKDTPFSINVTSGELIENMNAHNPADALKTSPTVAPLMSPAGYSSMSRVMIRGFNASDQSELRDGLADRSFTLPPVEDLDRIEVFNGVSGFLYGFSAVGGTVNYVTKPTLDAPFAEMSAGFYNRGIAFGHVDVGGPVYWDALTSRVNLYAESGDTYIDGSDQTRELVSGTLRLRLCGGTHLKVSGYYQHLEANGLPTYFNIQGIGYEVPGAFDPTRQYGQQWTYNDAWKGVVDFAIESRLSDIFTLRAAYRWGDMWRRYRFVGARLTDPGGGYTETFVDSSGNDERTSAAYALMDAGFKTWAFAHKLTFGYTHWGFSFERGVNAVSGLGPSHVDDPIDYEMPGRAKGYDRNLRTDTHNLLIGDRIELCSAFSVLGGVSYATIDNHYHGAYVAPGAPDHVWQGELTPTAGAVFKPIPGVSIYGSYIQALEQGGTTPGFAANAYQILDPTLSDQYEAGIKATLWDRLDLSLAFFQIEKINQYVDPTDNVYKQDGVEVHEGIEFYASGKLLNNLRVVGGFTVLSAEIQEAPGNPLTEGETPVNVPEEQARLYLEYELPGVRWLPGALTVSAGANYYGRRPVNIPNEDYIPATTTFDAGLRYQPTEDLTVNFTVSNLLDEHYWAYYRNQGDGAGEDGLMLGDPRLFSASVKYSF